MQPKVLVELSTGLIKAWGHSDFSQDVIPGQIEQWEYEDIPLPDKRKFCRWDFQNQEIIVDQTLKNEILQEEVETQQQVLEGIQHISLSQIAGKTETQIDNWIDNTVTDLASAKQAFKIIAKLLRSIIRLYRLKQDD